MRVRVVREGCIGCGQCAEICPQVFCLASDGLARVEQQPEAGLDAGVQMAAESCPVSVIELDEI